MAVFWPVISFLWYSNFISLSTKLLHNTRESQPAFQKCEGKPKSGVLFLIWVKCFCFNIQFLFPSLPHIWHSTPRHMAMLCWEPTVCRDSASPELQMWVKHAHPGTLSSGFPSLVDAGKVEAWWYGWLLCPKLLEDHVGETWPGRAEKDWNAVSLWRTKLWGCFLNSPLFRQWQLHSLIYHRESHSLWHGLVTKRIFSRKASFTKGLGDHTYTVRFQKQKWSCQWLPNPTSHAF